MEYEFEKFLKIPYYTICVRFLLFSFYNLLSPFYTILLYWESCPPHPHPHTLAHTHTHTLPVLYHTTPSPHLFITPFRSCKSSKVNFSLNLRRARRRCIVRRCSTRTYCIHTNGWWMNEKQISRGLYGNRYT